MIMKGKPKEIKYNKKLFLKMSFIKFDRIYFK